jgi:hypothetical protein
MLPYQEQPAHRLISSSVDLKSTSYDVSIRALRPGF